MLIELPASSVIGVLEPLSSPRVTFLIITLWHSRVSASTSARTSAIVFSVAVGSVAFSSITSIISALVICLRPLNSPFLPVAATLFPMETSATALRYTLIAPVSSSTTTFLPSINVTTPLILKTSFASAVRTVAISV